MTLRPAKYFQGVMPASDRANNISMKENAHQINDGASGQSDNLAILLPDGVGVRNFLLGPFLKELVAHSDAHHPSLVLHAIPDELLPTYVPEPTPSVRWETLASYTESTRAAFLRHTLAYAQMYWADTQAMRYSRVLPVRGQLRTKVLHAAARLLGRLCASPRGLRTLQRHYDREGRRTPTVTRYRKLFKETRPAVLFCSHQRPPSIVPPVLAARSLGIPTATFIFSWDNLSSKGRIAAPFDHYLVWSEHMKDELLRYYPDVTPERVHVVGTPQFDPYVDQSLLWTREEFFARLGADPQRPLLCYSGGDDRTCPEEPEQLRVLLQLVRAGAIKGEPQVMLRPSPVDDGKRYEAVRRDFPDLIYAPPQWIQPSAADWSRVLALPEDVQFLANLTQYADVNINLASTMTLDFGLHDKPVVNIAFDVADPPPFGMPLWDFFYKFEHYRPVVEAGAARFARSPAELAQSINDYLANPALDRQGRKRLADLEIGQPIGKSSRCILETLQKIARRSTDGIR